jgi:hypothetical protein
VHISWVVCYEGGSGRNPNLIWQKVFNKSKQSIKPHEASDVNFGGCFLASSKHAQFISFFSAIASQFDSNIAAAFEANLSNMFVMYIQPQ